MFFSSSYLWFIVSHDQSVSLAHSCSCFVDTNLNWNSSQLAWLEYTVRHGFMTVSVSWRIVWGALWFSWYSCIHTLYLNSRNNWILHVLIHQRWSKLEYIMWCFIIWKYPALCQEVIISYETFGGNSRLFWNLEQLSSQNCMWFVHI